MIRKQFRAIAEIIKQAKEYQEKKQLDEPIIYIAEHLADYFKQENPRFNIHKFFVACSLTD